MMNRLMRGRNWVLGAGLFLGWMPLVQATPQQDLAAFRAYFMTRFPSVPIQSFSKGEWIPGIASVDAISQYQSIMSFPPQTFAVASGKRLFHKPFPDGQRYADCFPQQGIGISENYPYFDSKSGQVVTLALAVNQCRIQNHLPPLGYKKGPLAEILAYMASTSAGRPIHVTIPDQPKALEAYKLGKGFFYTQIGALNLSCADCHMFHSGQRLRSQLISPALGMVAGFPVYRAKWGGLGTLDRRFIGCNKKIRVKPYKPQSVQYRDLQYFLTYMSNGIPMTGPGYRG